ncbi:hypothetical protein AERO8C_140255 [Aeromonas veronii]|uniref:Uncharacterized protein n=1 Tax=Aeromonas veronii TaxID=654 RepID=A0A653KVS4_AERVE|nr:hypothetical protein AERO8C_140255 [Aeromonas veronii]
MKNVPKTDCVRRLNRLETFIAHGFIHKITRKQHIYLIEWVQAQIIPKTFCYKVRAPLAALIELLGSVRGFLWG